MLVRYFTGLPKDQAEICTEIVEAEQELFVTDVALAETAHVLRTVYRKPTEEVIDRLLDFFDRPNILVYGLDTGRVQDALFFCRPSNRVSIPDALIWAAARSSSDGTVYTFDGRFLAEGINVKNQL
jgi:predicted nucleic acid-binding protein